MTHLVKSICLRNFDSVSKNHILGVYVYVMEAYTMYINAIINVHNSSKFSQQRAFLLVKSLEKPNKC
mgnify:CR=1 FL=1